ncbi:MAG: hypothetical protein EOO85_01145 [Pedobacter sp.]|nr:MAG: hypothetical protein EOO85_01145 [Pedobacter sp.]
MSEVNQTLNNSSVSPAEKTVNRKTLLITILVAIILIVAMWIWKSISTNNLEEQATVNQNKLKQQTKTIIAQTHADHLKLLAKPFVWSIRTEMMKGNNDQINIYMNEMVREKNFQRIMVLNNKYAIVSSTNKKDEGKSFDTVDSMSKLSGDDTKVENKGDSILTLISPIMGFNNRLGTLYIQYKVPSPSFQP